MIMSKDLKDLMWNVSEKEYRAYESFSYSILARYEKGGFSSIPHLYDPVESDAITFGSMVDCIVTEGLDMFNSKFAVVDYVPTESIEKIIKYLANCQPEDSLSDVSDDNIIAVCNILEYQVRWKSQTRIDKVRSEGTEYYKQLKQGEGKTFVDKETYDLVMKTADTLWTNEYTANYFCKENPNIKRYFQAKFRDTYRGIWTKCMFDLIVVDYKNKVIVPCDLKTTSLPEYDFAKKYLENRYDIQSRLYWSMLKQILQKDSYFKDFTIKPFRFIVINKNSQTPLVFEDTYSTVEDEDINIQFKSGRITTLRTPATILKELKTYLSSTTNVPSSIKLNTLNSLQQQIKKL